MTIHARPAVLGALLATIMGTQGCGQGSGPASTLLAGSPAGETVGAIGAAAQANPVFNPSEFVSDVTHPYFPLVPGTVSRFEGQTDKGLETIEIEVLRERKLILGVSTTVVRDRVYLGGVLVEDTFDWYAQDRAGNVWYLGEDVKNYENGTLVDTEGSWEAGVNEARAGINMEAHPRIGDRYYQEFAPGVAEDEASIKSLSRTVEVPYGTFENCLQTMEFTRLAPGARGYKYYAAGVGLVLEDSPRGGHERVELVSVTRP